MLSGLGRGWWQRARCDTPQLKWSRARPTSNAHDIHVVYINMIDGQAQVFAVDWNGRRVSPATASMEVGVRRFMGQPLPWASRCRGPAAAALFFFINSCAAPAPPCGPSAQSARREVVGGKGEASADMVDHGRGGRFGALRCVDGLAPGCHGSLTPPPHTHNQPAPDPRCVDGDLATACESSSRTGTWLEVSRTCLSHQASSAACSPPCSPARQTPPPPGVATWPSHDCTPLGGALPRWTLGPTLLWLPSWSSSRRGRRLAPWSARPCASFGPRPSPRRSRPALVAAAAETRASLEAGAEETAASTSRPALTPILTRTLTLGARSSLPHLPRNCYCPCFGPREHEERARPCRAQFWVRGRTAAAQ